MKISKFVMAMAIVGASFGVVQAQTKAVVYEYSILTTIEDVKGSFLAYTNSKGTIEEIPLENIYTGLSNISEKRKIRIINNAQILAIKLNELSKNGHDLFQVTSGSPYVVNYLLRKPIE